MAKKTRVFKRIHYPLIVTGLTPAGKFVFLNKNGVFARLDTLLYAFIFRQFKGFRTQYINAPVAQGLERHPYKVDVDGSIPSRRTFIF